MDPNITDHTRRELERELDVEIYPGTEIMRDVGSHHFVKANATAGEYSVLVPQPSDNEDDPLNWSPKWKASAMICSTLVTFAQGFGPLALAPMFEDYIKEFDSDLASVVQFTGVAILVLGFSNFIWVPLQTCFGRRVVLIASTIVCFGSSIWRAKATSYNSFMGACVLNGLGAGPAETAQPTIIADIVFLHDRGKYQTLYFAMYFGALMCGPIIAGPMAHTVGWRNFWWLNVALCGFVTITCIFFFPETSYQRSTPAVRRNNFDIPDHKKGSAENLERNSTQDQPNQTENEKPKATHVLHESANLPNADTVHNLSPQETHQDPFLHRGKPSKQQFTIAQPYTGSILRELWLPWYLFAFPIVHFAAFVVSWSASAYLTLNLTQSQAFHAPPYNFSSSTIGFFNFAILIGAMIGLATAGPLSDIVAARLTKKNRGVREPEMRLLAMVPFVILMLIGNVVVAVGYEKKWDWKIIVIIGYTLIGIQVTALPAISSTYAVDSYKPVAGSIFVAITVNKNVWGYGFGKFITPWIMKDGYIAPIMTNTALILLWCLTGVGFWFWGKKCRKLTRNSKVHRM